MANTEFGVNHALARKLWSKKLFYEALRATSVSQFTGKDSNALLQILPDTNNDAGDQVTYGLRTMLTGDGVQGDETLEGKEEALTFYSDSFFINQLRHAVRSAGKMSEQRVPYSIREEARQALSDWLADNIDTSFFNQIAGNTNQTDSKKTGNNTVTGTDSSHQLYSTVVTGEASLSASSVFSLTLIDRAVTTAKTFAAGTPTVRPFTIRGEKKYVCFIHPYQHLQLRAQTSAGQYMDIQKAAIQGGQISNNPIYTGAIAEYNNTILHESTRVPGGSGSGATAIGVANVYRAIFCGAQTAAMGFGQDTSSETSATWNEELFDYGNQLGVSAGLIYGLKKAMFNSANFGAIVLSSYSPAP